MDPITLAQSAIGVLVPYLVKAGIAVVEEAGPVWEKVKSVHAAVKSALKDDGLGQQALEQVEKEPENEAWQPALADRLATALKQNETLAEELQKLVTDAESAGAEHFEINVSMSDNAKVGTMTNISKAGDVNIGAPKGEPNDGD